MIVSKINFGKIFSVRGERGREDVVIGTNGDGSFSSARISRTDSGKLWLFHVGTASGDNIESITGEIDLSAITEAFIEGRKQMGIGPVSDEMLKILEQESKK